MADRKHTHAEIEQQVLEEYHNVAGKVVLISEVECYDEDGDSVTVTCDPPAVARIDVLSTIDGNNLLHWMDNEWLDPYLDVTILEPHPAFADVRPSWTFGTCRSSTGEVEAASFTLAGPELQERYRNAPGLDHERVGGCAPLEALAL